MDSKRELKPEELEKVSGGSDHFPHNMEPGSYWRCPKCRCELFMADSLTEAGKQQKIDDHMQRSHGT